MWEAIGLSVLTLVSVLIGYGLGKDDSPKAAQFTQNIYAPTALDPAEIYRQTRELLAQNQEGQGNE